jgi:hypothetical protein
MKIYILGMPKAFEFFCVTGPIKIPMKNKDLNNTFRAEEYVRIGLGLKPRSSESYPSKIH